MTEREAIRKAEDRRNRNRKRQVRATHAVPVYNQRTGRNCWDVYFTDGRIVTITK